MTQTETSEERDLRRKQVPANPAPRPEPSPKVTRSDRRVGKHSQKRHRPSGRFTK